MSKFLTIPYLAVSFLATTVYRWLLDPRSWNPLTLITRASLKQVLLSLILLFFAAWAVFGFSWSELPQSTSTVAAEESAAISLPTVLTATWGGIDLVLEHNRSGHRSFLLGE